MSTIVLDIRKPGAYRVEDFNNAETLGVTPDIFLAIDDAAFTADAREGIVRIRARAAGITLELNTYPDALRLKVRTLQVALYIISFLVGALALPGIKDDGDGNADGSDPGGAETPSTYELTFVASPVEVDPGQLVATPLRLAPDLLRHDWPILVGEVRKAFDTHGLGVVVNVHPGDDLTADLDGVAISLMVNDNHGANFVDHPYDLPPALYRLMEETPREQNWAAAVALARTLPNVPGDDDANAIVFWTRT